MKKTHVNSRDPRKAQIVAALKRRSKANKITLLVEFFTQSGVIADHYFEGSCLKKKPGGRGSGYENLGKFTITAKEAGLI